jgi:hypothetical protein
MEPKDFDINNFLFFAGDEHTPVGMRDMSVNYKIGDIASAWNTPPTLDFRCSINATVGNPDALRKWEAKIRREIKRANMRRIIIAIFMAKRGL